MQLCDTEGQAIRVSPSWTLLYMIPGLRQGLSATALVTWEVLRVRDAGTGGDQESGLCSRRLRNETYLLLLFKKAPT